MSRKIARIAEEVSMIGPRIGRRILTDICQVSDIPHAQLFVVMMLVHKGPSRSADIMRELKVAAPTATGIIDRLVKAGYVCRSTDAKDRRAVMVDLTPKGRTFATKLKGIVVKRWTETLAKISEADAEKYLEILKKINEVI
ncbi:MAG: winged helix-turn-helix transcriptional regulator [Candidatus Omnitrophica bacterium]|nr:winged helix-turn-helix transcriptional regulator [Candidatus Omnitrophota bacterium]